MKWKYAGVLLLLFFAQLVGATPPAQATSVYDDDYRTTDSLTISSATPSCSATQLDNQEIELLASSTDSSFTTRVSWAVSQVADNNQSYVIVAWSLNNPGQVYFQDNSGMPDAVTFEAYPYPATNLRYVGIYTQRGYTGSGDCTPYAVSMSSMSRISTSTGGWSGGEFMNYFVSGAQIHYPPNYDGEAIRTEPPAPPTTLYNGSIDCGNDSLEYMLLAQDGNTHPITLNYESTYRATWSYYLTDSPYTITVGCGSDVATSYSSITPMPPTSNDWICDTINDPHYCVLS